MNSTKQCFLIDDDIDDQEIFCMALRDVDTTIDCAVANDGHEALETLKAQVTFVPDFIFIDVNMPRMNGLECLREIKKLPYLSEAEIIMYSTTSDPNVVFESKQLGADDFIVKPSSISSLSKTLAKVLGTKVK